MNNYEQVINDIKQNAEKTMVPIMRPQSVKLLESLVAVKQPKRILEIGTAVGYSGNIMLNACKKAKLITLEKHTPSSEIAQNNFEKTGVANRVKIINQDAMQVLPNLKGKFDFIFLDGPKGQYVKYLPYLIKLLKKGAVLVADNVLFMGMVDGKVDVKKNKRTIVNNLQQFLKDITQTYADILTTTVLDIEDGISISVKR